MFTLITLLSTVLMAGSSLEDHFIYNETTVYNYHSRIGIPEATRIKEYEEREKAFRIIGGLPAIPLTYPYQAGLLLNVLGANDRSVCGGSVLSSNKVLTAAHCWFDGRNQVWSVTVVVGSVTLYSGGTRIQSTNVVMHGSYNPNLISDDIAMITLPSNLNFNDNIRPIALPPCDESFAGETATVSGFGLTADGGGISSNQFLSHVSLNVITNNVCRFRFRGLIQDSNICTSGAGGASTCSGDSGGPLVVNRNNQPVLIGVVSFGSILGCRGFPTAYARVTSYRAWINQNM